MAHEWKYLVFLSLNWYQLCFALWLHLVSSYSNKLLISSSNWLMASISLVPSACWSYLKRLSFSSKASFESIVLIIPLQKNLTAFFQLQLKLFPLCKIAISVTPHFFNNLFFLLMFDTLCLKSENIWFPLFINKRCICSNENRKMIWSAEWSTSVFDALFVQSTLKKLPLCLALVYLMFHLHGYLSKCISIPSNPVQTNRCSSM